jgi:hypothetical protein
MVQQPPATTTPQSAPLLAPEPYHLFPSSPTSQLSTWSLLSPPESSFRSDDYNLTAVCYSSSDEDFVSSRTIATISSLPPYERRLEIKPVSRGLRSRVCAHSPEDRNVDFGSKRSRTLVQLAQGILTATSCEEPSTSSAASDKGLQANGVHPKGIFGECSKVAVRFTRTRSAPTEEPRSRWRFCSLFGSLTK